MENKLKINMQINNNSMVNREQLFVQWWKNDDRVRLAERAQRLHV